MEGFEASRITRLDRGPRVVTARRAGSASTSVGVWARVGSVDEDGAGRGITHFLEHMVALRGTRERPAPVLSRFFDDIGAEAGASTSQEATEYRVHCLSPGFPVALETLADMVQNPSLDGIELERGRILDEIAAFEDDDEAAVDVVMQRLLYGDHPLGRRTIGESEAIERLSTDDLRAWHGRWYAPANLVVSAAGDVNHDRFAERVAELFTRPTDGAAAPAPPAPPAAGPPRAAFERRDIGQFQLLLGARAPTERDEDFWHARLMAEVLGGTSSSRLWTRIGEQLGLAYAVGAYHASNAWVGEAVVHVAVRPRDLDRALSEVRAELERLAAEPLEQAELARARNMAKADLLLEPRTPGDEQSRVGRLTALGLAIPELYQEIADIEAVTLEEARAAARLLEPSRLSIAGIGPDEEPFQAAVARHLPHLAR